MPEPSPSPRQRKFEAIGDISPLRIVWIKDRDSQRPGKSVPGGERRGRAVKWSPSPLEASKVQRPLLRQAEGASPAAAPDGFPAPRPLSTPWAGGGCSRTPPTPRAPAPRAGGSGTGEVLPSCQPSPGGHWDGAGLGSGLQWALLVWGCEQAAASPRAPPPPPISLSPVPFTPVLRHHRAARLLAASVVGRNLPQGASVAQVSRRLSCPWPRGDSPEFTEMIIKQSKAAGRAGGRGTSPCAPHAPPALCLSSGLNAALGPNRAAWRFLPTAGSLTAGRVQRAQAGPDQTLTAGARSAPLPTGGKKQGLGTLPGRDTLRRGCCWSRSRCCVSPSRDADGDRRGQEISFLFQPLRRRELEQCDAKPCQSSRAAGFSDQSQFPWSRSTNE